MVWRTDDFECLDCGHIFEELYKREDQDEITCAECDSTHVEKLLTAPGLATFSLMDGDGRRQHLLERSAKHTQKLIDQEPEKFKGGAGIERRTKKTQVGYGD